MKLKLHTYVMHHTDSNGKKKNFRNKLSGDNDARLWARAVVGSSGGTVEVPLLDGTIYRYP